MGSEMCIRDRLYTGPNCELCVACAPWARKILRWCGAYTYSPAVVAARARLSCDACSRPAGLPIVQELSERLYLRRRVVHCSLAMVMRMHEYSRQRGERESKKERQTQSSRQGREMRRLEREHIPQSNRSHPPSQLLQNYASLRR